MPREVRSEMRSEQFQNSTRKRGSVLEKNVAASFFVGAVGQVVGAATHAEHLGQIYSKDAYPADKLSLQIGYC